MQPQTVSVPGESTLSRAFRQLFFRNGRRRSALFPSGVLCNTSEDVYDVHAWRYNCPTTGIVARRKLVDVFKVTRICLYTNSSSHSLGGRDGSAQSRHPLWDTWRSSWRHTSVAGITMWTPHIPYRYAKPTSKRWRAPVLVHVLWLYWRHRFQILHCHAGYPAAYVAATFKRLSGVPFVVRTAVTCLTMIISVSTHGWSGACVAPWQQRCCHRAGRFSKLS